MFRALIVFAVSLWCSSQIQGEPILYSFSGTGVGVLGQDFSGPFRISVLADSADIYTIESPNFPLVYRVTGLSSVIELPGRAATEFVELPRIFVVPAQG